MSEAEKFFQLVKNNTVVKVNANEEWLKVGVLRSPLREY